ncbi:Ubiquilin [Niveomyces insectorum RCEF 264]|uniref:Ubiquilin n=1 Tax=Niveomyces insectorum RCEF 264 TaxID=1081102 RepID=A0A167VM59_9HYPO|nr:Ubiquilin [Niveomyces insectorum RCEF 264]
MSDNAEGSADPQITFKVKTSGDGLHTITMAESATVHDLKTKLATPEYENIAVERQRLIYSGRVMKNDDTLGSYKIKAGNTLHLVKSAASNHPPASASAAGSGAAAAGGSGASSGAVPPAVPLNMAAGTQANDLLAGLTGARFAGHAALPNQDIFGPDGGMNFNSEEQLTEMMTNPAVAQSVNEALNNPAFVEFLLQSNPALRATPHARELIQSPMFRAMITNPESLRMANRMRRAMGGAPSAFPAPGATDTTPADAPASPSGPGGAGAGAGGFGGFGAAGGLGGNPDDFMRFLFAPSADGGANTNANPFAALFNNPAFQAPAAGSGAGAGAGAGAGTTGTGNATAGGAPATTAGAAPGGADAAANPFAALFGAGASAGVGAPQGLPQITPELMQQALQIMGTGGNNGAGAGGGFSPFMPAPAARDTRPPEEVYAEQLRQLNDMGFYNFEQNVAALRRSGGSVQGAIQHLLGD